MENLLEVKNLQFSFRTYGGVVKAVRDVSFEVRPGEILGIVGESGCGKSVLCKSIMKLLPPSARIKEGSISVNGQDITCYREKDMQKLRGRIFSMIFQDPMTSLNPTIKIGKQIAEAVLIHNKKYTKEQVNQKVLELMELMGISHPKERYHQYPWQFSGGMRQRVAFLRTLLCHADILLLDEPFGALDVITRGEMQDWLLSVRKQMNRTVLLVTHDMDEAIYLSDRILVLDAKKGKVRQEFTVKEEKRNREWLYEQGALRREIYKEIMEGKVNV